jgi:hypothetical protein
MAENENKEGASARLLTENRLRHSDVSGGIRLQRAELVLP